MPVNKKIQVRRDTAANWTSVNPVLSSGEAGLETDTKKMKYGDGTTAWTSLAYSFVYTKSDIGLGNVDNTSDATKNSATATLTNKTLTSPVINTPTGIAKADVGLGSVDNTADTAKPVSTAQQTAIDAKVADAINDGTTTIAPSQNAVFDALALKAPLASPALTGTPTAPTATTTTNTTQVATTAFTQQEITANLTPDATTGVKGKVQLAGDLGGTAASPTTPTAVHITGNETVAGNKNFSGTTNLSGGVRYGVATASANKTLTGASSTIQICNATSAGFTVTLPAASTPGIIYIIKKIDSSANVVTISRAGSDTIDGATTYTGLSTQYKYVTLTSDGSTSWYIVGNN